MPRTKTTFKKGQVTNPKGRTKELAAKIEEWRAGNQRYAPEAREKVLDVMRNGSTDKVQLEAAIWICEQAYGKPPQAITGSDGGAFQMDVGGEALITFFERLASGGGDE